MKCLVHNHLKPIFIHPLICADFSHPHNEYQARGLLKKCSHLNTEEDQGLALHQRRMQSGIYYYILIKL